MSDRDAARNETTRPVWLTEGEAQFLDRASLFARWQSASPSPIDDTAQAIYREYGPMGTSWGMADPLRRERFRLLAKNVLIRALGWEAPA